MNEDNTTNDNLDDFSAEFFGTSSPAPKSDSEELKVETSEETSIEEETHVEDSAEVEETLVEDASNETDEEHDDDVPRLKGKKKTAQDRIDEVTKARREAEREIERLKAELEKFSAPKEKPAETEGPKATEDGRPTPDDLDADGNPKYALGEFDPEYLIDLQDWRLEFRLNEIAKKEKEQEIAQKQQEQASRLVNEWEGKLTEAEKEIPNVREKGQQLTEAFAELDAGYGEYLAQTIMQLEAGPAVMAYLADNLEEAQEAVSNGPMAATVFLGRLDAMLGAKQPKNLKPKVSSAPTPPPKLNRGSDGKFSVPPDTDDLSAFEKVFYKK